jgi:hypothetical protein
MPRAFDLLGTGALGGALVLLAAACGSGASHPGTGGATGSGASTSSGPPADAGTDGDAGFSTFERLILDNDLCLPNALPDVVNGVTSCRVFLVGVAAGCAQPGLAPASPAEVAATDAYFTAQGQTAPAGVCELTQVAPVPGGPGCEDESTSGWCYVSGSCVVHDAGAPCVQDICTTTAFAGDSIAGAFAFLACP